MVWDEDAFGGLLSPGRIREVDGVDGRVGGRARCSESGKTVIGGLREIFKNSAREPQETKKQKKLTRTV